MYLKGIFIIVLNLGLGACAGPRLHLMDEKWAQIAACATDRNPARSGCGEKLRGTELTARVCSVRPSLTGDFMVMLDDAMPRGSSGSEHTVYCYVTKGVAAKLTPDTMATVRGNPTRYSWSTYSESISLGDCEVIAFDVPMRSNAINSRSSK